MNLMLTIKRIESELLRNGIDPKLSSVLWNGIVDQSCLKPLSISVASLCSTAALFPSAKGGKKVWGWGFWQEWVGLLINLPHSLQLLASEQSPGLFVRWEQRKRDLLYVILKHMLQTALKSRKESRKNSWCFGREPSSSERGVSSESVSQS